MNISWSLSPAMFRRMFPLPDQCIYDDDLEFSLEDLPIGESLQIHYHCVVGRETKTKYHACKWIHERNKVVDRVLASFEIVDPESRKIPATLTMGFYPGKPTFISLAEKEEKNDSI